MTGRTTMAGRRCSICGRAAVDRFRPFCSRRCAAIDLGRWLKGDYRIPTAEAPSGAEAEKTGPDDEAAEHD